MIWMAIEDHERALDALERYIERISPFLHYHATPGNRVCTRTG